MNSQLRARRPIASVAVFVWLLGGTAALAEPFAGPFVIEGATVHGDHVVFGCGGQLWRVGTQGGAAEALTSGAAHDALPHYSPDGAQIAFLRRSDRLSGRPAASPDDPPPSIAVYDVYLLTPGSDEAQRLTHHPGRDFPVGWTPDARRVLLNSDREGIVRLFSMAPGEQLPVALPLPGGYSGSYSPDGKRLAYLPWSIDYHFSEFRHYRGGKTAPLWLVELETGAIEQVTDDTSNARDPLWVGERVYFLSDRDGRFDLYGYDLAAKEPRKVADLPEFGARGAATDGKSIVLVGDGELRIFDIAGGALRPIKMTIERDASNLRPRIDNAISKVQAYALGRDGRQAVVCARGDVLLVDTATGQAANVTRTSGIAERDARLSPDGKQIAYFSDVSGEYALGIRPTAGGKEKLLTIESQPTCYRELCWSPAGNAVAFSDQRLAVWTADLATGTVKQVDRSESSTQGEFDLCWSFDGRYLAYAKYGADRLPRIFVHDRAAGENHAVTPAGCHARRPLFDRCGRYLYFLSSPNAPAADFGWSVLSGVLSQPLVVRHLNAVVLHAGEAAPVISGAPNSAVHWSARPGGTQIDFDGLEERIVPIAVAPHLPVELAAGDAGILYLLVEQWPATPGSGEFPTRALYRLDLRAPAESKRVIPLVGSYAVSHDGRAVLAGGSPWRLATFEGAKVTVRPVPLAALPVPVDPAREWRQMTHEAWRMMRDFFYDPHYHGVDMPAIEQRYAQFLPGVRSREELNVLLRRMVGHVSVSHSGVGGGDLTSNLDEPEPVGLLGADLEVAKGRYRIQRVLRSGYLDTASPPLRAPLAQPGSEVAEGEFLLAIDDEPLDATQNIYTAMRGKAGRPIRLLIGPTPDTAQARTLRVVPLDSETALRGADWARRRRQMVDELSQGRIAYFHMPTYGNADIATFFRGYFAGRAKPGLIIDQRHNGGGITPDAFIELLSRRPLYYYQFRQGDDLAVPVNGRAASATTLIIDDDNGSAAETGALMFQLGKIGPLVGRRTFGAGIGPYGTFPIPQLVDGGRVRIPSRAAYNPAGSWNIENDGVRPDVAVDLTPAEWRAGRDPQLEAAVKATLQAVDALQPAVPKRPPYPVHP
ncbi:MAG: S41 family peptidase [Pirellulales bacterium]